MEAMSQAVSVDF